jgi:putative transposase
MPRHPRCAPGGFVYHALNRAVARLPLFQKDADYEAFERVLGEALVEYPTRMLAYCVMPNHWHFILWPEKDGELTAFLRWLTHTHTQRWHAHYHTAGTGHLYQGRFKSFPVQEDDHLLTVCRYVERNPLRAGLVRRAQDWRWSSLGHRHAADGKAEQFLHAWPVLVPGNWVEWVNGPQTEAELEAVRQSVARGQPFGSDAWQQQTAASVGLGYTLRPVGRPRRGRRQAGRQP